MQIHATDFKWLKMAKTQTQTCGGELFAVAPQPVPSAACDRDILCPLFLFGH